MAAGGRREETSGQKLQVGIGTGYVEDSRTRRKRGASRGNKVIGMQRGGEKEKISTVSAAGALMR